MSVIVATWDLKPPSPEEREQLERTEGEEPDLSLETLQAEIETQRTEGNSKNHPIVKLLVKHENQNPDNTQYSTGTGWLIRPDLLVTAGHTVFDWGENSEKGRGPATEIKAYLGYGSKREAIDSTSVQSRHGVKVVIPEGYLQSPRYNPLDVAFIQVNYPFKEIKLDDTLFPSKEVLGVVGYPGDNDADEEYVFKINDLQKNQLLEYKIETFRGQSGSPVFDQEHFAPPGIRAKGETTSKKCSNPEILERKLAAYISAFDREHPETTPTDAMPDVTYLQISAEAPPLECVVNAQNPIDNFKQFLRHGKMARQ
ncbi:hypothetical protein BJY04DRAFT_212684 [Aspergillus karnatakaensis]|uniref:trypsin-like serine peptidase n=1 Tax=Aspergillus karnatakaensis TaxID=1810916 RepID=UPI003CCE31C8